MFKWNKTKDTQISSNLNSFYINSEGSVKYRQNVETCREQEGTREATMVTSVQEISCATVKPCPDTAANGSCFVYTDKFLVNKRSLY